MQCFPRSFLATNFAKFEAELGFKDKRANPKKCDDYRLYYFRFKVVKIKQKNVTFDVMPYYIISIRLGNKTAKCELLSNFFYKTEPIG